MPQLDSRKAQREVFAPTFARRADQGSGRPLAALDHVHRRGHLAAATVTTRTSLASKRVSASRSPERVAAMNAEISCSCFASLPSLLDGAARSCLAHMPFAID